MIRRLSDPKLVPATRELASQFTNMTPAPGDRGVHESILRVLRQATQDGRFYPYTWATCFCRENGVTYRVNGKHGSLVLSEPGTPLNNVAVNIVCYEADTVAEVADLYKDFDRKESSRTSNDIYRIYAATDERTAYIPQHIVRACITGIALATHGVGYNGKTDAAGRAGTAMSRVDFFLFARSVWDNTKNIFAKAPTMAAMFETFLESPTAARIFWNAVRAATDPNPKSETRCLREYLLTARINTANTRKLDKNKKSARQEEVLQTCRRAWHKWKAQQ